MLLPVAASVVVTALLTGLAVWNLRPAPAQQPVTRTMITLPPDQNLATTTARNILALSPDGTSLVYIANNQLYLRAMDQMESRPIPGTEGVTYAFFSPDGEWVGFFTAGELKKVSISGGAPLTLCDAPGNRMGSWGADDSIIFGTAGTGLWQVSAAGGEPQELTAVDSTKGETEHSNPQLLPGGKAVIFTAWAGTPDTSRIEVLSLETGERKVLIEASTDARYVPTGHLVYAQAETSGTLLAVSFDLEQLEVSGAPVPIFGGVLQSAVSSIPKFSVSGNGSLVYVPSSSLPDLGGKELVWVDRNGAAEPLGAPPRAYRHPQLSPDGRRLAATVQTPESDVWVYDIPRGTLTRLTFEGANSRPLWTPDGRRIVFRSIRGTSDLYWKLSDGTGAEEEIITNITQPSSISPDGKLVFYYDRDPTADIWMVPLEGERTPSGFLQTPFDEAAPKISPDGQWLAYVSDESGRSEIFVVPFPGPGGKWQISTEGGSEPLWARNGGELFYRSGNKVMAVDIITQPSFQPGTPRMLFEGNYDTANNETTFDVSPDSQRFLMIQADEEQAQPSGQINVVLNWFEELKQRVPVQ